MSDDEMMELKDFRMPVMVSKSLVERIDTFRFANRIGTRAKAVRTLVEMALEKSEAQP